MKPSAKIPRQLRGVPGVPEVKDRAPANHRRRAHGVVGVGRGEEDEGVVPCGREGVDRRARVGVEQLAAAPIGLTPPAVEVQHHPGRLVPQQGPIGVGGGVVAWVHALRGDHRGRSEGNAEQVFDATPQRLAQRALDRLGDLRDPAVVEAGVVANPRKICLEGRNELLARRIAHRGPRERVFEGDAAREGVGEHGHVGILYADHPTGPERRRPESVRLAWSILARALPGRQTAPMRRRLFAILIAFLTACSESGFTPIVDPVDPGPDTAEAPTCALPELEPYIPARTTPCAIEPVFGPFDPIEEWTWTENPVHPGYHQLMATPVVDDLDADGVPDVVFTAFAANAYGSPGALVAVSGATHQTLWSITEALGATPQGASGVAIADLEGLGAKTVLVGTSTGLLAVAANGTARWHTVAPANPYAHPAVYDVDGDGTAEIVFGTALIAANGDLRWSVGGSSTQDHNAFAADLDADGLQEIIAGNRIFSHDGQLLRSDGDDAAWPALGDLDADGAPEIVRVHDGRVSARRADTGALVWEFVLEDGRGGPPTLADFDGDGLAEVGVASRSWYRVIDSDGALLWQQPVQDFSSSRTGSSVFDFEGDGAAEVVYADEETLWVWDGATGQVELAWEGHSSGTLYEYPLVVDIDADGSAEIVLASNDYSSYRDRHGITVLGDAASAWSPARELWNQHAYHISNVNDDGSIPANPLPVWKGRNSFRAGNSETRSGLALPDLALGVPWLCAEECGEGRVIARWPVENRGEAGVDGVKVAVRAAGSLVGVLEVGLLPAGKVRWTEPITLPASEVDAGLVYATVDDDGALGGVHRECVEVDNAAPSLPRTCP